jgi:hypothetical protein
VAAHPSIWRPRRAAVAISADAKVNGRRAIRCGHAANVHGTMPPRKLKRLFHRKAPRSGRPGQTRCQAHGNQRIPDAILSGRVLGRGKKDNETRLVGRGRSARVCDSRTMRGAVSGSAASSFLRVERKPSSRPVETEPSGLLRLDCGHVHGLSGGVATWETGRSVRPASSRRSCQSIFRMLRARLATVKPKLSSQLPAASLQRSKIRDLADSFGDQRLIVG